jgi:hypothetical protein
MGYWAAMSEENVEIVRKLVPAWNAGGVDALLRFCPEDVHLGASSGSRRATGIVR